MKDYIAIAHPKSRILNWPVQTHFQIEIKFPILTYFAG